MMSDALRATAQPEVDMEAQQLRQKPVIIKAQRSALAIADNIYVDYAQVNTKLTTCHDCQAWKVNSYTKE